MNFIETKKRILETYQEFIIKNLVDNKMLEINRIIHENEPHEYDWLFPV